MTIIGINNLIGKMVGADPTTRSIVADLLAFDVDGAERLAAFKLGVWNGKSTFLRADDTFEAGFTDMIRRTLREHGIPITIHDFRPEVTAKDFNYDITKVLEGIDLRPYQIDAVLAFLRAKRGVLRIATGGGKTEAAIAITKMLGIKTLFLTHKVDLVEQTATRYEQRLGHQVGTISEGEFVPSQITVASVQTLMSHWEIWWRVEGTGSKKPGAPLEPMARSIKAPNQVDALAVARGQGFDRIDKLEILRDNRLAIDQFLSSIELLIVDEAHRVSGNSFFKICGSTPNATYRLGLTATPLMKESREDNLRLIAACGDILCNISIKQLIELGVITQPRFTFYELPPTQGVRPTTKYPTAYQLGIVENRLRNALVIEEACRLKAHKPLILVKREEHGQTLLDMASARGLRALWVSGKTGSGSKKALARRQALDALRDGAIDVLIASTIFDEGLDEASIGAIILAGGDKAQIAMYQRVGRGGRLKRDGKPEETIIIDFIDTGNKHLTDHAMQRYKMVEEEEGWIIDQVVPWEKSKMHNLLKPYQTLNPFKDVSALEWFTSSTPQKLSGVL